MSVTFPETKPETLEGFKSLARQHKSDSGIPHQQALNDVAAFYGFGDYKHALDYYLIEEGSAAHTPLDDDAAEGGGA